MALEAPFRSSTGSVISALSAFQKMPVLTKQGQDYSIMSTPTPMNAPNLRPASHVRPYSVHTMSPSSGTVEPSPVTSNYTKTTEIEDEVLSETREFSSATNPGRPPQMKMLKIMVSDAMRTTATEEAISVVHAPEGFAQWAPSDSKSSAEKSDGVVSAPESEISTKSNALRHPTPSPISTNVKKAGYFPDHATPQAQNIQHVFEDSCRLRSCSTSSLESIPERHEGETDGAQESVVSGKFARPATIDEPEVRALKTALAQCWEMCNTLANLSTIHRERVFNKSGAPDAHEKAWKSCWRLCQTLYSSGRDATTSTHAQRTNLDLCRDFCQSLFDVRQRKDETGDSVLRVSFELNNHLYSAQDSRNLPGAFQERTLEFYITLCHRLMKQHSELVNETDSLLRACWSLAEMLFSLRQKSSDGKTPDEELLGSAVQACWELCDIFRESWTQVRPDRGTLRPNQVNFFRQGPASELRTMTCQSSMHSKRESQKSWPEDQPRRTMQPPRVPVPETPVTDFEDTGDTPISPDSDRPHVPNIMVLGSSHDGGSQNGLGGGKWSSSASNLSGYSHSSGKTSSTATTATLAEDINITRIKMLIVKAAMNIGYNRVSPNDSKSGTASLQSFVQKLPVGSFGSLPVHATLLQSYKNLVLADTAFRTTASLPSEGKRVKALDVAQSVEWMRLRSGQQYGFLRDLFTLVFGFPLDEAENRKSISIAV